jgi:hypothetical protein
VVAIAATGTAGVAKARVAERLGIVDSGKLVERRAESPSKHAPSAPAPLGNDPERGQTGGPDSRAGGGAESGSHGHGNKQGGVPPGLAKKQNGGIPPGLAKKGEDWTPPGQARNSEGGTPPGQARKAEGGVPPGQAKKDGAGNGGQANRTTGPPGQTDRPAGGGQSDRPKPTPPGQEKKTAPAPAEPPAAGTPEQTPKPTPPGQAKEPKPK